MEDLMNAYVFLLFLGLFCLSICVVQGDQKYDLLVQNGHLIDPKNGLDGKMDVAILDGRIAGVDPNIPRAEAREVVDASGLFVTPGLIDLHVHVFHGTEADSAYCNGFNALPPDGFTFRGGVTTVVDAGGAGWRNFTQFKKQTIDRSETRVLAFLNIVGSGMKGDPFEQDLTDMNAELTAQRIRQFSGVLVGVKVAHYRGGDWAPVDRAVEAGELADVPVMVDFGSHSPPLSLADLLLVHLRPGDILTHAYAHVKGRMPVINAGGEVEEFVLQARKRGLLFDVGHGAGSFLFRVAVPAMQQGFSPDTISTDLHARSMNAGMKDLLNVMSKFLNLGMTLREAVSKTTWEPAGITKREDLGHLSVGAPADVALLRLHTGSYGFLDVRGGRLRGNKKLECELVLREGRVVWDLNGLAGDDWQQLPSDY
jgi:dihydroorotase